MTLDGRAERATSISGSGVATLTCFSCRYRRFGESPIMDFQRLQSALLQSWSEG
jgi:hypothetical protein